MYIGTVKLAAWYAANRKLFLTISKLLPKHNFPEPYSLVSSVQSADIWGY